MRISDWSSDVCSSDLVPQFSVAWEVAKRRGRKVTEVAITFRRKAPIAVVAAEEENERHRAGRRARREGTVETVVDPVAIRSEEHTSEHQSLMRISYVVYCFNTKAKSPPPPQLHRHEGVQNT